MRQSSAAAVPIEAPMAVVDLLVIVRPGPPISMIRRLPESPLGQPPPQKGRLKMRKNLIGLAAASLAIATPAMAKDFVVQHDDLNLATAKGQKMLDRRIDAAARDYCGMNQVQVGTRIRSAGKTVCYNDARNAAREQMASLVAQQTRQTQLGG
ncbi:UrcA family protein [Parafrankia sp. BMG5.11]|nr:UrcA family protein [Parafrankia sp. BMG5.11]